MIEKCRSLLSIRCDVGRYCQPWYDMLKCSTSSVKLLSWIAGTAALWLALQQLCSDGVAIPQTFRGKFSCHHYQEEWPQSFTKGGLLQLQCILCRLDDCPLLPTMRVYWHVGGRHVFTAATP